MNTQIDLDDFTEKGLEDFLTLLKSKGLDLEKYFIFDKDLDIEDLTKEGGELLDEVELEGVNWQEHINGISPSLDYAGDEAEGGYFDSVKLTLFLNKEFIDISNYITDKKLESVNQELSEEMLG